jgi:hypothetical protein
MKKLMFFSFGILICGFVHSQKFKPDVISNGGGLLWNSNVKMTYTIGEPVSGRITNGTTTLTQGFQQTWNYGQVLVLSLSAHSNNVGDTAGKASIDVTSNIAWTANSNQTWLTLNPASGTGNHAVSISWTANTTLNKRTGIITFTGIGVTLQTYTIVQDKADSTLTLSSNSLNAEYTAGNTSLNLLSNIAWTATSNQTWLTLTPESGTGNQSVAVNWSENTTFHKRTGTITFIGAGVTPQLFTVVQDSTVPTLTISSNLLSAANKAGFAGINVTSNTEWTATSDQTWLTIAPESGTGNQILAISWTDNTSGHKRDAFVTFQGVGVTAIQSFRIIQDSVGGTLTISSNLVNASNTNGNASINLSSNISWTATSDQTWLTISPESGTGNRLVTFNWTENTSINNRNCTVIFTGIGVTQKLLTIVQKGKNATVINNTFSKNLNVIAYPNPTKDFVTISLSKDNGENKFIELFNNTGQLLKKINTSNFSALIDLSGFTSGLYLIRISSPTGAISSIKIQKIK